MQSKRLRSSSKREYQRSGLEATLHLLQLLILIININMTYVINKEHFKFKRFRRGLYVLFIYK